MSECTHDCSSCTANCSSKNKENPGIQKEAQNPGSAVKKVIGIVSGKGGVGKSLVTGLMASAMMRAGFSAAVLDADITGPSIPKLFGLEDAKAMASEDAIFPVETEEYIKVMSINLLLDDTTSPVVWRGPVIAGAVKQFWTDVAWGDVDYMFVDMPPGTGDVPLTVFQSLPVDGILVVASPQDLVKMVVEKAVNMAKLMNVPILGLVENMSYVECPNCSEKIRVFGDSHIDEIASKHGLEVLARIPIKPEIAKACDEGKLSAYECDYMDAAVEKLKTL